MKKILLVCAAGMSTSLLVSKMQKAAEEKGVDVKISATPGTDLDREVEGTNVLLLGPQIGFKKAEYEKKYGGKFPVEVINTVDYGMMNGEKVLNRALELMEEK